MPALETIQLPLGFIAPDFKLWNPRTQTFDTLSQWRGNKATVILFLCNHCPFVKHINAQLIDLASEYIPLGVGFIGINSNDINRYPDDAPQKMLDVPYPFPYLFDETQEIAKAYQAVCTPDLNVFDAELRCVYRGQLDESRPNNGKICNGSDLRRALDHLLQGKDPISPQLPSIGCSVKWKIGNEPNW